MVIGLTGNSRFARALGLSAAVIIAGGLMLDGPTVASAASPGGGPAVSTSCTASGYQNETYIDDSGYTGLIPVHDYETYFTYGTGQTFNDGGFVSDSNGDGALGEYIGLPLPGGTGYTWELRSGATAILDGAGAVNGPDCVPHNPPRAPQFGSASDTATNSGVVTIPLQVTPKTTGTVEILQGAGVVAEGGYDDASSSGGIDDIDSSNATVQLSKAQLLNLWWTGEWVASMKITSNSTSGTSSTTDTHEIVEPAQFDPVTISKSTITAAKTGKYKVVVSGDPSLYGSSKVKLGSKKLNSTDDQQLGKSGKLTWTFKLSKSALKHLKKEKKEKVSIAVQFAKGTQAKPVTDRQKVTLKAPKKTS